MTKPLKIAAIGLDHRHIYGQCEHMIRIGAELSGYWTEGDPNTLPGFEKRFGLVSEKCRS